MSMTRWPVYLFISISFPESFPTKLKMFVVFFYMGSEYDASENTASILITFKSGDLTEIIIFRFVQLVDSTLSCIRTWFTLLFFLYLKLNMFFKKRG